MLSSGADMDMRELKALELAARSKIVFHLGAMAGPVAVGPRDHLPRAHRGRAVLHLPRL
jgi:hypothetical protein